MQCAWCALPQSARSVLPLTLAGAEASAAPVELFELALAVVVAEEVFVVLWLPEEQV